MKNKIFVPNSFEAVSYAWQAEAVSRNQDKTDYKKLARWCVLANEF